MYYTMYNFRWETCLFVAFLLCCLYFNCNIILLRTSHGMQYIFRTIIHSYKLSWMNELNESCTKSEWMNEFLRFLLGTFQPPLFYFKRVTVCMKQVDWWSFFLNFELYAFLGAGCTQGRRNISTVRSRDHTIIVISVAYLPSITYPSLI